MKAALSWFPMLLVLSALTHLSRAQIPLPQETVTYTLLPGSVLMDDCPICGRPTIQTPLRGAFTLRFLEENPLFRTYAVEDLDLIAESGSLAYKVQGGGTYQIGGEVAIQQDLRLDVRIDDGFTNRTVYFTNTTAFVERLWPMFQAHVRQTNDTPLQVFDLVLSAAPLHEIWFSTAHNLTSGNRPPPEEAISQGDALSHTGRVVRRQAHLTQALGIMPITPDLGLDAMDVQPGGEILFSLREDVFSESLGPLQHGDLLSDQGRVIARNQDLTAAFSPMPPVPDIGLDAVHVMEDGEIWFSTGSDLFSETLGGWIRRGDLLSNRGVVIRSQAQLLQRFHPAAKPAGNSDADHGLDALYAWLGGEIWFSLEEGFQDDELGPIQPGDLLSDQGYVVWRNLDLVNPFAPLEDLADFGLDALFIVGDLLPAAPPPQFTLITIHPKQDILSLEWSGRGRAFQVQRSESVTGPFEPASPIMPDFRFEEDTTSPNAFYRLRQW